MHVRKKGPGPKIIHNGCVFFFDDDSGNDHREGGPAFIYTSGVTDFCLNGIQYYGAIRNILLYEWIVKYRTDF